MFETASEWIALALTLLAGWLFGLASAPGGRKYRDRYTTERDAHAAYRRDMDGRFGASDARVRELEGSQGRIADLERDRLELATARTRIADLERENGRLTQAAPVVGTSAPVDRMTKVAPVTSTVPLTQRAVGGDRPRRGWFDFGPSGDPRSRR